MAQSLKKTAGFAQQVECWRTRLVLVSWIHRHDYHLTPEICVTTEGRGQWKAESPIKSGKSSQVKLVVLAVPVKNVYPVRYSGVDAVLISSVTPLVSHLVIMWNL